MLRTRSPRQLDSLCKRDEILRTRWQWRDPQVKLLDINIADTLTTCEMKRKSLRMDSAGGHLQATHSGEHIHSGWHEQVVYLYVEANPHISVLFTTIHITLITVHHGDKKHQINLPKSVTIFCPKLYPNSMHICDEAACSLLFPHRIQPLNELGHW